MPLYSHFITGAYEHLITLPQINISFGGSALGLLSSTAPPSGWLLSLLSSHTLASPLEKKIN